MSARYRCNFCGEELTGKANSYSEIEHLVKKDGYGQKRTIVACITMGPLLEEDACKKCWKEIRNKFVQELNII